MLLGRWLAVLFTLALLAASLPATASDTGAVRFVVTDAKGKPLAGAEVGVWGEQNIMEAVTDAEGQATIDGVPTGEWIAWAAKPGHTAEEQQDVEVVADRKTTIRLALSPGISFSGRVLDVEGKPVADAYVEAVAGGSFEGYGEWKARSPYDRVFTGEDGTFRIRGIPEGAVTTLVVKADGFREARVAARAQGGAVRPTPLVISLDRGGVLKGIVRDPSGKPVPGATVFVVPADEPGLIANPRIQRWSTDGETVMAITVKSGPGGRFVLGGLALDEAVVALAEAPSFARSRSSDPIVPSAARRTVEVELRLRAPATLVLRVVTPDGSPATAGKVRIGEPMGGLPSKEAPDAPGLFRFHGLPPGEHRISIETKGWLPHRQRVVLEEGKTKEVAVTLRAGAVVAGVARDREGRPLAGADVMLTRVETTEDGGWTSFTSGRTETDAEGRFEIRGLAPGRHELMALIRGSHCLEEDLVVDAPAPKLELTLRRLGSLRVRFESPEGGPALPDSVFVWQHGPDGGGSGTGHDLEDGVLRLGGFRGKEIRLAVQFDEFVPFLKTVRVDWSEESDLGRVVLDPGVTVSGRVTDLGGEAVAGALVSCAGPREAVTAADGSFSLLHVAAGEVEIDVEAEGFLPISATVASGPETKAAALTLRRGALVEGHLLNPAGEPLDNYWIQFRRPPTTPDDPKGEHLDEVGTEEDGSFSVRLPAGRCRILFVTEEGIRVLATLDLEEGMTREVSLTLDR